MKILANFVSINGTRYVLPGNMSDKEVSSLCGMLLFLRPLDSVYSSDYKTEFHFQQLEHPAIRLGSCNIYTTEEAARAAREARNSEIEASSEARARADDLSLPR
jgi:hypothetical protein